MNLYIDPGTGSVLFSVVIGLVSVIWFGLRKLYIFLKYRTAGKTDANKKDIVIYGEDKRYWTVFKGILDEFEKRKVKVTYLAGSEDDPLLDQKYEYVDKEVIGLGNKAYAKLNFLNAHIVFATTPGLDVFQWKRSKDVDFYVHITHSVCAATTYQMFGTEFFDAVLLSSDTFFPANRELEEKRNSKPKELLSVGCTYMDYMLNRKESLQVNRTAEKKEKISVLVAPTWGSSGILSRYGSDFIRHLISTGFDITIRPHPQSFISETELIESLMKEFPESDSFHWNRDADNFSIMEQSDLLISDFSGSVFDFSFIFERPILYTELSMDMSEKDEAWLDEPYFGLDAIPRLGKELKEGSFGELKQMITELVHDQKYHDSIIEARNKYWQNRGEAAVHVADYLLEKLGSLKNVHEERA